MKFLAFPVHFQSRPQDLHFRSLLEEAGLNPSLAELMLYRVWRYFANAGSDRRLISTVEVRLVESSSGFTGGREGQLVDMACEAGFLRREPTGDNGRDMMVCEGFYPINAPSGGEGARSRGAFERARKVQALKAAEDTREHLTLWGQSGRESVLSATQDKQAMMFLYSLSRAFKLPRLPDDAEVRMQGGLLERAWQIVSTCQEADVDATMRLMIARRKDPELPQNLRGLLDKWPDLLRQARAEKS